LSAPRLVFHLLSVSSQGQLELEIESKTLLISSMVPQIWYLLVNELLPVAFVTAKPVHAVGFELTLDFG
jgi:hypothetical protein